jgi:hypothetical protein
MIHSLLSGIRKQKSLLIVIVCLTFFWLNLKSVSGKRLSLVVDRQQQSETLVQTLAKIIQPTDSIFLVSQNRDVLAQLQKLSLNVYFSLPGDNADFDNLLVDWLNLQCRNVAATNKNAYFIWTDDQDNTIELLGNITRKLIFFAGFDAVVPYQGKQASIADKIFFLNLRARMISMYCEEKRLAGNQSALVVVNANEFPPVIGSVTTGNIIWLASNETRTLYRENYVVKNLPIFLQFAGWSTNFASTWSFNNQETKAYELSIKDIKNQNGVVFVDKTASLGEVPAQFLKKCADSQLISEIFEQVCIK